MSGFDEEFLNDLRPAIQAGKIKFELESHTYEAQLRKPLPWNLSGRIDWEELPPIIEAHIAVQKSIVDPPTVEGVGQSINVIQWFLSGVALYAKLSPRDRLVGIGDMIGHVVSLSFAAAVEYCDVLFSYPQHMYLVPPDCSWVFQYTFEDDMYFAFAPGARDGHPEPRPEDR